MTARDPDFEQLSFDFEKSSEQQVEKWKAAPTASIYRFPDTLGQRVRQRAIKRVMASGIFSVDELKEG